MVIGCSTDVEGCYAMLCTGQSALWYASMMTGTDVARMGVPGEFDRMYRQLRNDRKPWFNPETSHPSAGDW